jgi:hypothetical protein
MDDQVYNEIEHPTSKQLEEVMKEIHLKMSTVTTKTMEISGEELALDAKWW